MLQGFRAEILSVPHDPAATGTEAVSHHPDGLLVVENGIVIARGEWPSLAPRYPGLAVEALPGLLVPGFVDTHVHYPQLDRIASHGEQLLSWLSTHIFPAEAAFADRAAAFFLDELLRNGTTSALVFATVHAHSVDALFDAALARNMRIVSGKVLMDLGPESLRDTPERGRVESEALIARWRGRGRLGYAVTPRFALTSSDAQLATAGDLLATHPDTLLHTHLAENRSELAAVAERFNNMADYLDVYDRFGMVGPCSVFAHGIHLEERALGRMAHMGSGIAFCPSSDLFLGSGLFDLARAPVSRCCPPKVKPTRSASCRDSRSIPSGSFISQRQAVRACSASPIGSAPWSQDRRRISSCSIRRRLPCQLADRLFALQILGDDRAIHSTYVAGRRAYGRDITPADRICR